MKKKINFILINGPMGSGKSTIVKLLHPKLKRTALLGGDRIKWFMSDFKRSRKNNEIVHKVIMRMCDEYLKNGISILLDQGFYSEERADKYLKIAKKYNCVIKFYHLQAPRQILLDRIRKRPTAKMADKPVPKTRVLRNLRNHNKIKYTNATIIDTFQKKPKEVVDYILKDL